VGESLYGKFGFDAVIIGLITFVITFFVAMTFGWLMPEIINNLIVFGFIITIVGIVLGIVGIIKDDLKEKAIRTLIAGICFLILGSVLIVLFDMYISALLG
jgi:hypothetical protein